MWLVVDLHHHAQQKIFQLTICIELKIVTIFSSIVDILRELSRDAQAEGSKCNEDGEDNMAEGSKSTHCRRKRKYFLLHLFLLQENELTSFCLLNSTETNEYLKALYTPLDSTCFLLHENIEISILTKMSLTSFCLYTAA